MDDHQQLFHVLASTEDGQVFERDVAMATALGAVTWVASEVEPVSPITHLHVRRLNQ